MNERPGRPTGAAFLLAQVGALGDRLFAERIAPLGLSSSQSGLLRAIAGEPGRSQNELAAELGVRPSRLVVLVDELEDAGLVQRDRDPDDRRRHVLQLTPRGRATWFRLVGSAAEHEATLCAALTVDERHELAELLRRIAEDHGLPPPPPRS
ncbi:MarR family winged helix-turn-helix transcriptional regulator [Pseudonocardia sp. CA-107938]|uniref:MarR family winged helix-turn-helix transcriptional regulator n=1 Tax=Pseudonocardia sp. CA-107938 TaxID=3240021 RepID=UPI003D8CE4A3